MRRLGRFVLTIVAGFATVSSAAYPDLPMNVVSVRVRFRDAFGAHQYLDLRASFSPDQAPAFDPLRDDLQIVVGSSDSFRVGPGVLDVVHVRGKVVTFRGTRSPYVLDSAPSAFRLLRIDFGRGRLRAVIDHANEFAFRQDGPWNV